MMIASAVGLAVWAIEQRRRRKPRGAVRMTQTREYLLRASVQWWAIVATAVICSAVLIAVAAGLKR